MVGAGTLDDADDGAACCMATGGEIGAVVGGPSQLPTTTDVVVLSDRPFSINSTKRNMP